METKPITPIKETTKSTAAEPSKGLFAPKHEEPALSEEDKKKQVESQAKEAEAKKRLALEERAKKLYAAYSKALDGVAPNGAHLPTPDDLFKGIDYSWQVRGWLAVAEVS